MNGVQYPQLERLVVEVSDINSETGIATVKDNFGKYHTVAAYIRRGGGRMPVPGETWIIDRSLGQDWTFAALISMQNPEGGGGGGDDMMTLMLMGG